jgi:hypothetical protein
MNCGSGGALQKRGYFAKKRVFFVRAGTVVVNIQNNWCKT